MGKKKEKPVKKKKRVKKRKHNVAMGEGKR